MEKLLLLTVLSVLGVIVGMVESTEEVTNFPVLAGSALVLLVMLEVKEDAFGSLVEERVISEVFLDMTVTTELLFDVVLLVETVLGTLNVSDLLVVTAVTKRVVSSAVELVTIFDNDDEEEVGVCILDDVSDDFTDLDTTVTGEVVGMAGRLEVVEAKETSDDLSVDEDDTGDFERVVSVPMTTLSLDDVTPVEETTVDGRETLEDVMTTGDDVREVVV